LSNSFRFDKPPVITEYIIETEKLIEGEEHRFAVFSAELLCVRVVVRKDGFFEVYYLNASVFHG